MFSFGVRLQHGGFLREIHANDKKQFLSDNVNAPLKVWKSFFQCIFPKETTEELVEKQIDFFQMRPNYKEDFMRAFEFLLGIPYDDTKWIQNENEEYIDIDNTLPVIFITWLRGYLVNAWMDDRCELFTFPSHIDIYPLYRLQFVNQAIRCLYTLHTKNDICITSDFLQIYSQSKEICQ